MCGPKITDDRSSEKVFTRQKEIADANPESPPRTQHKINIHSIRNPSQTVFTEESNELFNQKFVQDTQGCEGEVLHYHVVCLNKSSTEDDSKIVYYKLALRYDPNKNKHPQASAAFRTINEAKEVLEEVFPHNDIMRRVQEREEDIQLQEESWIEDEQIGKSQEEL